MTQGGWKYAPDEDGAFLLKEIKKAGMSKFATAKLQSAMTRVDEGIAKRGEHSQVRDGVSELRINADGRWYRVMYGRHQGNYVALSLVVKKSNKLAKQDIDKAVARLKAYVSNK